MTPAAPTPAQQGSILAPPSQHLGAMADIPAPVTMRQYSANPDLYLMTQVQPRHGVNWAAHGRWVKVPGPFLPPVTPGPTGGPGASASRGPRDGTADCGTATSAPPPSWPPTWKSRNGSTTSRSRWWSP